MAAAGCLLPVPRRTSSPGPWSRWAPSPPRCGGDGGRATARPRPPRHRPDRPPPRRRPHRPRRPPRPRPPAAQFVVSGPTDHARVALTFHTNGDLDLADQLLDVLDSRHVKMTSFIVGDWLDANPDMAKRIADGGHEFANHTYTHPTFLQLWPRRAARRDRALSRRPRAPHRRSRAPLPSVGHRRRHRVARRPGARRRRRRPGTPPCSASTSTRSTTRTPVPTAVTAAHARRGRTPGSIVSLHFGHPGTVDALPAILDGLDQRGPRRRSRCRPCWAESTSGASVRNGSSGQITWPVAPRRTHGTHRDRGHRPQRPRTLQAARTPRDVPPPPRRGPRCTGSPTSSRAAATGTW